MINLEIAFWLILLALSLDVGALFLAWRNSSLRKNIETRIRRLAAHQSEWVLFAESHESMLKTQQLLEDSIEGTTATVRGIHRGIAAIPFGILEAIPATRDTTKLVRGVHDMTSDVVYSSISSVNRLSGKGARRVLGDTTENTSSEQNPPQSPDPDQSKPD